MEKEQYEIECGRCRATRLEFLTEVEARAISDGIGPVYRQCERCGRMTGWIAARVERAETQPGMTRRPSASGQIAERLIPRGQERMATQSECDEVNAMLRGT